jgi:hypothetical protein
MTSDLNKLEIDDAEVRRLITYVQGFARDPDVQPAGVRGDPQLQWLKGYITSSLERQPDPVAVLDFG